MPVIGGAKGGNKVPEESEHMRHAEIGIAVEQELKRYQVTLREIDQSTEQRKLAAERMFANRVQSIVQRYVPLVSGSAQPETDAGETAE